MSRSSALSRPLSLHKAVLEDDLMLTQHSEKAGNFKGKKKDDNKQILASSSSLSLLTDIQSPHFRFPHPAPLQHMAITPQEVTFEGCKQGSFYSVGIKVQNISSRRRIIKLLAPCTPHFSLEQSTLHTELSPGLTMLMRIHFTCPTLSFETQGWHEEGMSDSERAAKREELTKINWHDRIVLLSESDQGPENFVVPLHAYQPRSKLQLTPVLDFTHVLSNQMHTTTLPIVNKGSRALPFHIVLENDAPLLVTPTSGIISPNSQSDVTVQLHAAEPGPFRSIMKVYNDEQNVCGLVDVSAIISDGSLQLFPALDTATNDKPTTSSTIQSKQVEFNTVYYGEKKEYKVILKNNSPVSTNFVTHLSDARDDMLHISSQPHGSIMGETDHDDPQSARDNFKPDMSVTPSEGRLEPYQSVVLTFLFQPHISKLELAKQRFGFKSQQPVEQPSLKYHAICKLDSLDGKVRLVLPIHGAATSPQFSISREIFDFHTCELGQYRDTIFEIQNISSELQLEYEFDKIAQFKVKPSRGVLLPLQTQSFILKFQPNNLGVFQNKLIAFKQHGVTLRTLNVSGVCRSVDKLSKTQEIKSPSATSSLAPTLRLPSDFESKLQLLSDSPRKTSSFERVTGWNDKQLASKFQGRYEVKKGSMDNRSTFTPEELRNRVENRKKYENFLKSSHYSRTHEPQQLALASSPHDDSKQEPIDEFNMGLKFADGLAEPSIIVPKEKTKLKLMYSMAGYEGEGRKRNLFDKFKPSSTSNTSKKAQIFKLQPSTQAEKRDCETRLTPDDLMNIVRSPKVVEFGTLSINARGERVFAVTNDLEQHIQVDLKIRCDELTKSFPTSQLIPPGETAHFNIVFNSNVEQDFKKSVIYTINNQHDFNFLTTATVVPMTLNLSHEELVFDFQADNSSFYVSESVTLHNPYTEPAEYWWTTPTNIDGFYIYPSKGIVEANQDMKVEIRYEPKYAQPNMVAADLILNISGGPSKKLSVRAHLVEASCAFKNKVLDFQTLCIGTSQTRQAVIRNNGSSRTVFRFEEIPSFLKIKPSYGQLAIGQSLPISVTIFPQNTLNFKQYVSVNVRGKSKDAKPLKLLVKGECVLPDLSVAEEEFNFGGVTLGSSAVQEVTLSNNGNVAATVFLDLSQHSEFTLINYNDVNEELEVAATVSKISTAYIRKHTVLDVSELITPRIPAATTLSASSSTDEFEINSFNNCWSIVIQPQQSFVLNLQFTPNKCTNHIFELNFSVSGIPSFHSLRRVVTAQGLKPKISLSTTLLSFGPRVIVKRGRANKHPYVQRFQLKNEDSSVVQWRFVYPRPQSPASPESSQPQSRLDSRADSVIEEERGSHWKLEPQHGTLNPGQDVSITVYFSPTSPIVYNYPVEIHLDSNNPSNLILAEIPANSKVASPSPSPTNVAVTNTDSRPYTFITLMGQGTFPRLVFDRDEVMLPIVPLGIQSTALFHIKNEGYENLEVKHEVNMDSQRAPITITLLEGATLSLSHPILPVQVTFLSKKPISFTTNIDFYDNENNKFSIPVTGISDNSILTTQQYLESHVNEYDLAGHQEEGKSIVLIERQSFNRSAPTHHSTKSQFASEFQRLKSNAIHAAGIDFSTHANDYDDLDDSNRLTPLNLLPHSVDTDSISLYAHTLDSVLAYFHASNLMNCSYSSLNDSSTPSSSDLLANTASLASTIHSDAHRKKEVFVLHPETFPADLIQAAGKPIRTILRNLTGKVVPSQASRKKQSFLIRDQLSAATIGMSKSEESAWTAYEDYEDVLTFMKSYGCLLGSLKPWHFLSYSQLLKLLSSPRCQSIELTGNTAWSNMEVDEKIKNLELIFPSLSRNAWLTVLIQIIKVFITSRITLKTFQTLPGISSESMNLSFLESPVASNIYSTSENIILLWLSYHYNRSNPLNPKQLTNFDKDLHDGLILSGVITSHISNLTHLQHLRQNCVNIDDCVYNAQKLVAGCKEAGLNYRLSVNSIIDANARDLFLFCLYLYQKLPNFIPKTTIEFKGKLHEEIVKSIELSNPSSKVINYHIRVEGSNDFKIDKYTLQLQPRGKSGSTVKFPIRFCARFTKPVECRLIFHSEDEEDAECVNIATLVFSLKSFISSRQPTITYDVKSRVYEQQVVELRLTNIFPVDCTFNVAIKLDQEPPASKALPLGIISGKLGKFYQHQSQQDLVSESQSQGLSAGSRTQSPSKGGQDKQPLPPPFFCAHERVKLKANETLSVPIQFLPLRLGTYKAQIIFLDDVNGEIMHAITATALPPAPIEHFRWTTYSKASDVKDLYLSYKNAGLETARQASYDRIRNLTRHQRDLKKAKPDWPFHILRSDLLPPSVNYNIYSTSPFFSAPHSVTLDNKNDKELTSRSSRVPAAGTKKAVIDLTVPNDRHGASSSMAASGKATPAVTAQNATQQYLSARHQDGNKFPLTFNPKAPGVYKTDIILMSTIDTRVYSVEVTVAADEQEPTLEFQVPARQSVTQEIPIHNKTTDTWNMKSVLVGKGFTAPADLIIPPNTTGLFPLTFSPSWICQIDGRLELCNVGRNNDGMKMCYELKGVGIEPLAQSHVVIDVHARSTLEYRLPVVNSSNTDIYYTVEHDFGSILNGPVNFRIEANSTLDYVFNLSPMMRGKLFGTITFMQPDKKFQWYSVELDISPPKSEQIIELSTVLRKSVTHSIPVKNPLDHPIVMDVLINAIGVFGPMQINLGANEEFQYQFNYCPLIACRDQSGSISFSASETGEFWYELNLNAAINPPVELPLIECEVGQSKSVTVLLENPIDQDIKIAATCSNSLNFATKPNQIIVPASSSLPVSIRYTPSTMNEEQYSTVTFKHPIVGEWIYHVRGVGVTPNAMPDTVITTPIDTQISRTVQFRNPFGYPIKINIQLIDEEQPNRNTAQVSANSLQSLMNASTFQLFMKKTSNILMQPYTVIQIPFLFSPKMIANHNANVIVTCAENDLKWNFRLIGIAEGSVSDHSIVLRGEARVLSNEVREIVLNGLKQSANLNASQFSVDLEGDEAIKSQFDAFFRMSILESEISVAKPVLRLEFQLHSLKPIKSQLSLLVLKNDGGRWRFPLTVNIASAPPDDTITVESMVNQTSSVAFRLKNINNKSANFTASLSLDSASEFHIFPKSGVLSPANGDGTQFVLSFSPTEYGHNLYATIIIQTAEMQWSYKVVGRFPMYKPPVVAQSKIDNHNDHFKSTSLSPRSQHNKLRSKLSASSFRAASSKTLHK